MGGRPGTGLVLNRFGSMKNGDAVLKLPKSEKIIVADITLAALENDLGIV